MRSDFQTFLEGGNCRYCQGALEEVDSISTWGAKNLAELQAFLSKPLPGAKVSTDPRTGEVVIHTNIFTLNGDPTNTLVSKEKRAKQG